MRTLPWNHWNRSIWHMLTQTSPGPAAHQINLLLLTQNTSQSQIAGWLLGAALGAALGKWGTLERGRRLVFFVFGRLCLEALEC